jgi:hypothetical protein
MWLNMFFLTIASLCVGFILGWIVARPRRWETFPGGGFPSGAPVEADRREQVTGGASPGT